MQEMQETRWNPLPDLVNLTESNIPFDTIIQTEETKDEPLRSEKRVLTKDEKIELRIKQNQWDIDAWSTMIAGKIVTRDTQSIRLAFDRFLTQFPTNAKYWLKYCELERKNQDYVYLETLFARCLRSVLDISLWKFYIQYILHVHPYLNLPQETQQEAKNIIVRAFEFCLEMIGMDKDSSCLWTDYLNFVKSWEAKSSYEEQQKMDQLRKIYHKILSIPLNNIEDFWREYDAFENKLSKITAKTFIAEKSAVYMTSRLAVRELKVLLDPIQRFTQNYVAYPPSWNDKECQMLEYTRRYLSWEKSNPLSLDNEIFYKRVEYAFHRSLLFLRQFPVLWVDAFEFFKEISDIIALSFLEKGIEANRTSPLMVFTWAEYAQNQKMIFEEITSRFDSLLANIELEIVKTNSLYDGKKEEIVSNFTINIQKNSKEDPEDEREQIKIKDNELIKSEAKRLQALNIVKQSLTLVYIVYMRLARRDNEKTARLVFSSARKNPHVLYQVYVASALMEFHCSKDATIPGRIFEHALKTYASFPDQFQKIVHAYMDFLIGSNNDKNARALFERAISVLPNEYGASVWDKMMKYESEYGEVGVVSKLEKRREEREGHEMNRKCEMYFSFQDLDYVNNIEFGGKTYTKHTSKIPKFKSSLISKQPVVATSTVSNFGRKKDNKYPAMESYFPSKYARPNLSSYSAYKPEEHKPDLTNESPLPSSVVAPAIPKIAELSIQLPSMVTHFLSMLTPSTSYSGPVINADQIVQLFRHIDIPVPSVITWSSTSMDVLRVKKRRSDEESHFNAKRFRD